MPLTFTEIKQSVAKLAYADPTLLSMAGLDKLATLYESYSVKIDGQCLCILLRRGLTPRKAGALTEKEAVANVLVLQRDGAKWSRVWPAADTAVVPPVTPEVRKAG